MAIDPRIVQAQLMFQVTNQNDWIASDTGLSYPHGSLHLLQTEISQLPFKLEHVGGNLILGNSQLTTLEGVPNAVGKLQCPNTQIKDFIGGPEIADSIIAHKNQHLKTLEGIARIIHSKLDVFSCPIKTFKWLPMSCEKIWFSHDPMLGLLPLLMVKNCTEIYVYNDSSRRDEERLNSILNRYLSKGRDAIISCAAELHKAGYGSNAKL
jgi:hypothetical protein